MNTNRDSTSQRNASSSFKVSKWKAFEKNTVRGFFSVTLPSGLIIHNLSLHVKGNSRWVGPPSQRYAKQDGSTGYTPIVEFASRESSDRFRDLVLEALDRSRTDEAAPLVPRAVIPR